MHCVFEDSDSEIQTSRRNYLIKQQPRLSMQTWIRLWASTCPSQADQGTRDRDLDGGGGDFSQQKISTLGMIYMDLLYHMVYCTIWFIRPWCTVLYICFLNHHDACLVYCGKSYGLFLTNISHVSPGKTGKIHLFHRENDLVLGPQRVREAEVPRAAQGAGAQEALGTAAADGRRAGGSHPRRWHMWHWKTWNVVLEMFQEKNMSRKNSS